MSEIRDLPIADDLPSASGWFGDPEWDIRPIPVPWWERARHPIFYGKQWGRNRVSGVKAKLRQWGGCDDCCC